MDPREELQALRRLAELEAKASPAQPSAQSQPSAPADPYANMGVWDKFKNDMRGLGRFGAQIAVAPAEALGQAAGLLADYPFHVYNAVTGKGVQTPSESLSAGLDQVVDTVAPKQPVAPIPDRTPVRTAAGMVAGTVMNPMGPALDAWKGAYATPKGPIGDMRQLTGSQRVAERGANLGLKVNPATPELKPSLGTRALGWMAGNDRVNATLSQQNQGPIQAVARAVGELEDAEPLSRQALSAGQGRMGQAYANAGTAAPFVADDILKAQMENPSVARAIGQKLGSLDGADAADAVQAWQKLRDEASAGFNAVDTTVRNRTLNRQAAQTADDAAKALKDWIDRSLRGQGMTGTADDFASAPRRIAQSKTLADAVVPGAEVVDPAVLSQALRRDVPISGNLRTVGEFASAFPGATRSPVTAMGSHSGEVNAAAGNLAATGAAQMAGASGAAAAANLGRGAGIPLVHGLAQRGLMRESLQRAATGQDKLPGYREQLDKIVAAWLASKAGN